MQWDDNGRRPLPPRIRDLLISGPPLPRGRTFKRRSPRLDPFGNAILGTDGWEHCVSRSKTWTLVRWFRRQGWSAEDALAELMHPGHAGSLWLRRQDDPQGEFDRAWQTVKPAQPELSDADIDRAILDAVAEAASPLSKRAIRRAVPHWNDGDVFNRINAFIACGSLRDSPEERGTRIYSQVTLAVSKEVFEAAAYSMRCDLRDEIREAKAGEAKRRREARVRLRAQGIEMKEGHLLARNERNEGVQRATPIDRAREEEVERRERDLAFWRGRPRRPWARPRVRRPELAVTMPRFRRESVPDYVERLCFEPPELSDDEICELIHGLDMPVQGSATASTCRSGDLGDPQTVTVSPPAAEDLLDGLAVDGLVSSLLEGIEAAEAPYGPDPDEAERLDALLNTMVREDEQRREIDRLVESAAPEMAADITIPSMNGWLLNLSPAFVNRLLGLDWLDAETPMAMGEKKLEGRDLRGVARKADPGWSCAAAWEALDAMDGLDGLDDSRGFRCLVKRRSAGR